MNLRRLITLITFLAIFAMAARISVDTDTWWHLRAGAWMVEHGKILQQDVFSYTRFGERWEYPGWLVEVPMYWLYVNFGAGGLNLFTALLVTIAFIFVWLTAKEGVLTRSLVLLLAATSSGIYWAARPYLVTFVLSAGYLWILENFYEHPCGGNKQRLFFLPVLMAVWVNSHGGFAVGFLLILLYLFAHLLEAFSTVRFGRYSLSSLKEIPNEKRQSILLLFQVSILMLFGATLNPAGASMLTYPFQTIAIKALKNYIAEWQSPDFQMVLLQPVILLGLLTLFSVGFSSIKLRVHEFLLVAVFGYMGLTAVRNIALFALVAPLVIVPRLNEVLKKVANHFHLAELTWDVQTRTRTILNYCILSILSVAVLAKVSLILPASTNEKQFRESLPMGAVEFLKEDHPPGRLFNSYNWGGYILWALPEYPVFIDGRTDLYSDEIIDQWLKVVRAEEGWRTILEQWQVGVILLEENLPVVRELESSGWRLVYRDALSVIFVHP